MYQHPKPLPRTASPTSPRANSTRYASSRPASEGPSYNESDDGFAASGEIISPARPSESNIKKLDQIIQNFHTKAAIVILQSRVQMIAIRKDNSNKINKWFQLETDETDSFREELRIWRTCGGFDNRPPPLILETYLDTSALTSNQSLVIVDDHGRRWDVFEALNRLNDTGDGATRHRKRATEVILERWEVRLNDDQEQMYDFGPTLPTIYKKCIIFFRSLYSTSRIVPTYKFVRSIAKGVSRNNNHLRIKCRVLNGHDIPIARYDALNYPLYDSDARVTTTFDLDYTSCPAGRFSAKVTYRNDCNFRVDDSEALLSSQFMGADEKFFKPSLAIRVGDNSRHHDSKHLEIGSLPTNRQSSDDSEPIQAYGSLSTFHGNVGARASSPISTLRAVKTMGSDSSSPPSSGPKSRPTHSSRASLTSTENVSDPRRPSLSRPFQPFKAGSLSASPSQANTTGRDGEMLPPPSPQSIPRGSGISALAHARKGSSLTAGMPASLRGAPPVAENAIGSSVSSSPKPGPTNRYSSSFSNRRGRISFGGTSRVVDDDQVSSGKQSLSSSVQPGSGILAEGGGSSGSLQADDNDISDFLKLLDAQKTLKSFEPANAESSNKRTVAQLSKFQMMRESNNALGDSMSSSMMLQRSSSSSSRQLSSVPPMIAGNSISTSSSPGKPISPHTPHTPAIPSRLSANSTVEYSETRHPPRSRASPGTRIVDEANEDDAEAELGTNAIDIPTSPRPYYPHIRRSSSVAQQHRAPEDDLSTSDLPFGIHRSISLGAEARPAPSLSDLLEMAQRTDLAQDGVIPENLGSAPVIDEPSARGPRLSSSLEREEEPQPSRGSNPPYRPRLGRVAGRGVTPPQGNSYSSLNTDRGSGSGTSDRPGGRYSFTRPFGGPFETDDEPLLFDMSEIGRDQSRRSLEEARGGGIVGGGTDRGGYDSPRGGDSSSSSRRGSRRGWQ